MDSIANSLIDSTKPSHFQNFNKELYDAKQALYPPYFSPEPLSETILNIIKAELEPEPNLDLSFQASMTLHALFRPQLRSQSHDLTLLEAWDQLYSSQYMREDKTFYPPEYFLKGQEAQTLLDMTPEAKKEAFKGLVKFIQDIENMSNQVKNGITLEHKEQISEALFSLKAFYSAFQGQVLALTSDINQKRMILQQPYDEDLQKLCELLKPKAVLFGDVFPEGTSAFRIPQKIVQRIITEEKIFKPSQNIIFQQIEQNDMVYSLYRLLDIPIPQKTPIALADDNGNLRFFEVSEAIPETLPLPENGQEWPEDHHKTFCLQVLGTLLTTPSNPQFIYDPTKYGPILDNTSSSWNPALSLTGDTYTIKSPSPLYSLPTMDRPVPDSLHIFLRNLSIDLVILTWLQDLETKRQHHQQLISACLLYSQDLSQPKYTIPQALIDSLRTKLSLIIEACKSNNVEITPQNLLETVFPSLGSHYKALRNQQLNPPFNPQNPSELEISNPLSSPPIPLQDLFSITQKAYFKTHPHILDDFMEKYSEQRMNLQQFMDKLKNSQMNQQLLLEKNPECRLIKRLDPQEALRELLLYLEFNINHVQNARNFVDLWCKGRNVISSEYHTLWDRLFFAIDNLEVQWFLALDKYLPRDNNSSCYQPKNPSEGRGALISKRQLSQELQKDIFNQRQSLRPLSLVRFPRDQAQTPVFYIKKEPELAGYEYAVTLFLRAFGVEGIPFCELLMMKDPDEGLYSALLMQAIEGKTLEKTWLQNDHIFEGLDPHHTQMLILGSMLLNPEDGRANNFILTKNEKRIIPIHNGHVFVPGFSQSKELLNKTILYCLPEMNKPIQESVIQKIINLNVDALLSPWLAKLLQISERSYHLPSEEARARDGARGIFYRIGFPPNFIERLYEKFHKMQERLSTNNPELRPFDILLELEPEVAKAYQEVFLQESTVRNRFSRLTASLYESLNGPRYNSLQLLEILEISPKELIEKHFIPKIGPAEALSIVTQSSENYQKIFCYMNIIKERVKIDIEDAQKLRGAAAEEEFITKKLENHQLQILALKNSNIKNFSEVFVQGDALKALILPRAKSLTQDSLKILRKNFPNLESLIIGDNKDLKGLALEQEDFPNLKHLNVSNCPNLMYLRVEIPGFEALEMAGSKDLKIVGLVIEELKYLDCQEEKMEILYVSKGIKKAEIVGRSVEELEEKIGGIELLRTAEIVEKVLISDIDEKGKQDILKLMFYEGVRKVLEKKLQKK